VCLSSLLCSSPCVSRGSVVDRAHVGVAHELCGAGRIVVEDHDTGTEGRELGECERSLGFDRTEKRERAVAIEAVEIEAISMKPLGQEKERSHSIGGQ